MALELLKDIVKIPAKGIFLTKDSTQAQLAQALKHEPKLSLFISNTNVKTSKKDDESKH